ncbi:SAVED domain-containing protein [Micromonospora antibiotica]|uniref:SAVED domain-containing protein n=1 Tax=Micromonospora antibiotica TaxID=2807623 RepID=A0ABS3V777_9ACTN|nr:SAVED domain-containing protein [Micromonospora antibiotica]MBO4161466.1 SAVED domain-containing protein [Micromonospora antibiotica]
MTDDRWEGPGLTVFGSATGGGRAGRAGGRSGGDRGGWAGGLRAALSDGTAAVAVGGALAGGLGVEAAKSVVVGESAGRWWFVVGSLAGTALLVAGFGLRERAQRQVRVQVGIVATARDAGRGLARARQYEQQAEEFSRSTCAVTVATAVTLSGDPAVDKNRVEGLADETFNALMLAQRLTPEATRVNLIPTMPLHLAFWFGARLGHTHSREVRVHAVRQADGSPPYFAATALRATESATTPLTASVEAIAGGDPSRAALALDLQGFGRQFTDPVRETCRQHAIGHLLILRSAGSVLAEDAVTYTGVVEQARREWLAAALPSAARTGRYAVFLSGSVAISLALGARLAASDPGRWTVFSFDRDTHSYQPFPLPEPTR